MQYTYNRPVGGSSSESCLTPSTWAMYWTSSKQTQHF